MAAKAPKIHHTAGIFSDMTIDGPEIGTLVAIVDRAKNLPNRKKIGKQDPYCAARLGKEAKKTEVDKRGGQTPKWDQELRFVVHDSADYNQLKVSLFNDDKKTELIGETWISLESVVVPGGGQSDLWHNLHCKGKYAGEIRIELTYYDSRPKDEKQAVEARRESARYGAEEGEREAVGGPRQLRQTKRRPVQSDNSSAYHADAVLPDHALPPLHNGTSPWGYRPSAHPTQSSVDRNSPNHTQPNPYYQQQSQAPPARRAPPDLPGTHHSTPPRAIAVPDAPPAIPQHHQSNRHEIQELPIGNDYRPGNMHGRYDNSVEEDEAENQQRYGAHPYGHHQFQPSVSSRDGYAQEAEDPPPPPPAHGSRNASPGASPGIPSHSRSHSTPSIAPPRDDPRQMRPLEATPDYGERGQYQPPHLEDEESSSTYSLQDGHHPVVPRHHSPDGTYGHGHDAGHFPDDGPPPPPPAHRSSGNQMTLYQQPKEDTRYGQTSSPTPLNHQSDSLALQYHLPQQDGYPSTAPPPASRVHSQSASVLTHASHVQSYHSRRPSDVMTGATNRESFLGLPPSLIPGIDPNLTEDHSGHLDRNRRESLALDAGTGHSVPSRENSSHHGSPRPRGDADVDSVVMYQDLNLAHISRGDREARSPIPYQDLSAPHHHHPQRQYPFPQQEMRPTSSHSPSRRQSLLQQEVPLPPVSVSDHRRVAPMIKPRPISPDLRSTPRKSVSPQPQSPLEEGRLSGIPFSPDSYDALNPNLAAASSINEPSAQYQTPEQAKETFRQRQREAKRGGADAPIYGADGRVIDPSDHLPSDTWAPEPERKSTKKEATRSVPRSRPTPQGAQPMPSPGQQRGLRDSPASARLASTNASIYASDPQTPPSAGRNRLQKKSRYSATSPTHPNSSPIDTPPLVSYSGNGTPRSLIASEHPLREHENYGYGTSPRHSRGYSQDSSIDHPPPIPAKIALGATGGGYREDDSFALTEELKRIDIGSGSGKLAKRRQY